MRGTDLLHSPHTHFNCMNLHIEVKYFSISINEHKIRFMYPTWQVNTFYRHENTAKISQKRLLNKGSVYIFQSSKDKTASLCCIVLLLPDSQISSLWLWMNYSKKVRVSENGALLATCPGLAKESCLTCSEDIMGERSEVRPVYSVNSRRESSSNTETKGEKFKQFE